MLRVLVFAVLSLLLRAAGAQCSGTGTVTGPWPDLPLAGQVWVTDSADSFNQQTSAGNAFGAARSCSSVSFSGRQSSQVNLFLGSCTDPANDGMYTWTDSLHTCDMSLPLTTGEPPADPPMTTTQAVFAVGLVLCFGVGWVTGRQR